MRSLHLHFGFMGPLGHAFECSVSWHSCHHTNRNEPQFHTHWTVTYGRIESKINIYMIKMSLKLDAIKSMTMIIWWDWLFGWPLCSSGHFNQPSSKGWHEPKSAVRAGRNKKNFTRELLCKRNFLRATCKIYIYIYIYFHDKSVIFQFFFLGGGGFQLFRFS